MLETDEKKPLQIFKDEFCKTGENCPHIEHGDHFFSRIGPQHDAPDKKYKKKLAFGPHCFPATYTNKRGRVRSSHKSVKNACHIGPEDEACIPATAVKRGKSRGSLEVSAGSFDDDVFDSTGQGATKCTEDAPCILTKKWLKKNKKVKRKLFNAMKNVVCPDFGEVLTAAQALQHIEVEAKPISIGKSDCPAKVGAAEKVNKISEVLNGMRAQRKELNKTLLSGISAPSDEALRSARHNVHLAQDAAKRLRIGIRKSIEARGRAKGELATKIAKERTALTEHEVKLNKKARECGDIPKKHKSDLQSHNEEYENLITKTMKGWREGLSKIKLKLNCSEGLLTKECINQQHKSNMNNLKNLFDTKKKNLNAVRAFDIKKLDIDTKYAAMKATCKSEHEALNQKKILTEARINEYEANHNAILETISAAEKKSYEEAQDLIDSTREKALKVEGEHEAAHKEYKASLKNRKAAVDAKKNVDGQIARAERDLSAARSEYDAAVCPSTVTTRKIPMSGYRVTSYSHKRLAAVVPGPVEGELVKGVTLSAKMRDQGRGNKTYHRLIAVGYQNLPDGRKVRAWYKQLEGGRRWKEYATDDDQPIPYSNKYYADPNTKHLPQGQRKWATEAKHVKHKNKDKYRGTCGEGKYASYKIGPIKHPNGHEYCIKEWLMGPQPCPRYGGWPIYDPMRSAKWQATPKSKQAWAWDRRSGKDVYSFGACGQNNPKLYRYKKRRRGGRWTWYRSYTKVDNNYEEYPVGPILHSIVTLTQESEP